METLLALYARLKLAGVAYRNFENEVASHGDTINTRLPRNFVATPVNPASFSPQTADSTNVQIKLDTWKEVVFGIDDKTASLSLKDLQQEFFVPAAEALTLAVEESVIGLYKGIPNFMGSAASAPTGIDGVMTDVRQKFSEMNIPDAGRNVVLNPTAYNEFLQVFAPANISGSADAQNSGQILNKGGMNYMESTLLPTHTQGGWGTSPTANAATAGATSIGLAALGTGQINEGDVFAIGTAQYVVTENATITTNTATVNISPALKASHGGATPVIKVATHAVNLGLHSQALALVTRPLKVPQASKGAVDVVNYNGIGLRACVWYEPKDVTTYVRLDLLWGVKLLDTNKAFRILG